MSRHEGVSCDSCLKGNFRGHRYKCLVCYDYDLCSACYEARVTTSRHKPEHPMQCILTRADYDLFFGSDASGTDGGHSYACPYCGKLGFTESTLHDHVSSDHNEASSEVICPICASSPGGDPNHVTDDFSAHLTLEHRGRELSEPLIGGRLIRRAPLVASRNPTQRARRYASNNQPGSPSQPAANGSAGSGGREAMDPIAELLSHLSGVRRAVVSGTPQQLRELHMQLEVEREHARALRDHFQRLPRIETSRNGARSTVADSGLATVSAAGGAATSLAALVSSAAAEHLKTSAAAAVTSVPSANASQVVPIASTQAGDSSGNHRFLLTKWLSHGPSEGDHQRMQEEQMERSLFAQELILATLNGASSALSDSQLQDTSPNNG